MITVFCRIKSERDDVLKILERQKAVWTGMTGGGQPPVKATSQFSIPASGRIYFIIDDSDRPWKVTFTALQPKTPFMNAVDFIHVHKFDLVVAPEVYPFDLVGEPVELTKGNWFRQVSTAKNFILEKPVQACYRGGNTFGIIACIKGREKPIVGSPNGSAVGDLFVKVKAPEKIVKMTKADLQKLVAEKFGSNAVLQIDERG